MRTARWFGGSVVAGDLAASFGYRPEDRLWMASCPNHGPEAGITLVVGKDVHLAPVACRLVDLGMAPRTTRHPETDLPWYGVPDRTKRVGRAVVEGHLPEQLARAGAGIESKASIMPRAFAGLTTHLAIRLPCVVDCQGCGESVRVDALTTPD